jgi:hypothetical protein
MMVKQGMDNTRAAIGRMPAVAPVKVRDHRLKRPNDTDATQGIDVPSVS